MYLQYARRILDIGSKVQFIVQERQLGFGHAVYCARECIAPDESFLLVLGDHLYSSTNQDGISCVRQLMDAYSRHRVNVLGLKKTALADVSKYGCATGVIQRNDPQDDGTGSDGESRVLDVTHVTEKPTQDYAMQHMRVHGLPDDQMLTMFGLYIVSARVFSHLHGMHFMQTSHVYL